MNSPKLTKSSCSVERYFFDQHQFIEIEFYKDGEAHRVWPYIGHAAVETSYRGANSKSDAIEHFVVDGAFETQDAARDAVLREAVRRYSPPPAARGYIHTWNREKFSFDPDIEKALTYSTRQAAEDAAVNLNNHDHVTINGGTYTCKNFQVERRGPHHFVLSCVAPFFRREVDRPRAIFRAVST